MNDMSSTIVAKSDQFNAADLIGTPVTITVKEVRIKAGEDQPVSIIVEEDKKAFRPCKGVRRLIVRVWGADASKYVGQSMTIFCDPSVTWAGKEEGGIRVSHMTGIDEPIVEYMRTSRAATKPYKVLPLRRESKPDPKIAAENWANEYIGDIRTTTDPDELAAVRADKKAVAGMKVLAEKYRDLHELVLNAAIQQSDSFRVGRSDEQHGDQHTDDDPFADRITDDLLESAK